MKVWRTPSISAVSDVTAAITGRYADGVQAISRPVVVEASGNALRLFDPDAPAGENAQIDVWPFDDVVLLDNFGRRGARFGRVNSADPRLTVDGEEAVERLRAQAPSIFKAIPPRRRPSLRLLALTFLAIGSLVGTYFALPYLTGPVAMALPATWFEEIGRTSVEQIGWVLSDDDKVMCEDDAASVALHSLVERLGASLDDPPAVMIHVVNGGMVNAFAAPGGHIVILRGLIDFAEDPAELVGVVAHELAHAASRDAERGLVHQVGRDVLKRVLIGDASTVAEGLGVAAQFLLDLSHSREVEAAADALAIEMLTAAGMRTDGLASFFERLEPRADNDEDEGEAASESFLPDILSTHPPSAERAIKAAQAGAGGEAGLTDAEWQAIGRMCDP